jgi:uncharacterized phage protein (TIGR01671 family)
MNREIKFRYIFRHKASGNIEVKHYYLNQLEERNAKQLSPCFLSDYEMLSRDQYTGLTDKKKNEIYEGDIVHLTSDDGIDYIALITFQDGGFCAIDGTEDDYAVRRYGLSRHELHVEVVGNVTQNPELVD